MREKQPKQMPLMDPAKENYEHPQEKELEAINRIIDKGFKKSASFPTIPSERHGLF